MPRSKPVFKLTASYIEWVHDALIRVLWSGVPPHMPRVYRNKALLESAAARPFQSAGGQDIHNGLFDKGAALFHSLIANHPFEDGNKRTAVSSLLLFLLANGVLLFADEGELYKLAMNTASAGQRHISQDEVLDTVREMLIENTTTLLEVGKIKGYRKIYQSARQARGNVRNHPLNRQPNG